MNHALGPVSAALETDLRGWVRRNGVVVWLDLDGHYTGFVDRLIERRAAGELPYEIKAFRGSHLELMLALESLAGGVERSPLAIHLPGFNEELVRATPMLELYAAGVRYRKGLDTLIAEAAAGKVLPTDIEAFCGQAGVSLEAADQWLADRLEGRDTGLGAQLRALGLLGTVGDLLLPGEIAKLVARSDQWDILRAQLAIWTGLPTSWKVGSSASTDLPAEEAAFAVASWALCVEYVDDLRRAPIDDRLKPVRELLKPLVEACRELAAALRARHSTFYKRTADETEAWLTDEVDAARAEDLGKIDTFFFEEQAVLTAAIDALRGSGWKQALEWADLREDVNSFWLRTDPPRRGAWRLIRGAARLGEAIAAAPKSLRDCGSLELALQRYTQFGAAVDQAHRHLEQGRAALLDPGFSEFERLRARLDEMRQHWRTWADSWAADWNVLCLEHGFLPPAHLQQRTLFDEVVRPLCAESGITALFLVDALRFEMGEELYRALADTTATQAHLRARLAELPTVTEVGMNVLAPVADHGRLRPALSDGGFLGFSAGEFRVTNPKTRKRAMHDRIGGSTCPWLSLSEVLERDSASLRRTVAQARLVVVHSLEIDEAGEAGFGPSLFDKALQDLRSAWRLLREAGVQSFIITADHGFLMFDASAGSVQAHGRKIDPKRRYVISSVAADHRDEVRVPLSDLGYEEAEGHLMFPTTTALFDTGDRTARFVHGGNSLQERVIPVLSLIHRAEAGSSVAVYAISAQALGGVANMHCLQATVDEAQQNLNFVGPREIELRLRVLEVPGIEVELCETRGEARLSGGTLFARVGQPFELFFRLTGPSDARVLVELYHSAGAAEVSPCTVEGRFVVSAGGAAPEGRLQSGGGTTGAAWLEPFTAAGVRQLFEHLATHGAVTETEAAEMLGGPRLLRKFSVDFEGYAAKAPFGIRIDVVAGVKRYVREGKAP